MSDKQSISPTWCILPWIHLSTRPNGHARICCTANASSAGPTQDKKYGGEVGILKNEDGKPANFNHTDLKTAWNNSYMRNIRTMMLNGEKPPSCLKCYKEEDAGYNSKRQWETRYWSERIDVDNLLENTEEDGSIPMNLPYIDLRFGTKCNLKCIMCSPHDSSAWIPDWKKMFPELKNENLKDTMQWNNKGQYDGATYNWHKVNPTFWEQLYEQIPNMKQLYFAGGEPLIIEEHYELLQKCIDMGYADKIELRYNSNGTVFPDKLFKLWEQFMHVRFHFSIDSINEMDDYIRYPSNFNDLVDNLWLLENKASENVDITIACALQALNIYYIPDFIKWKLKQGFTRINPWPFGAGLINTHFVYHPAHLNVKVLPKWFKAKTREKFEEFYVWLEDNVADLPPWEVAYSKEEFMEADYGIKRLKGMISFMESEDWSVRMPEFREYIKTMDNIRGTDFSKTFPEMKDLMDATKDY